MGFAYKAFGFVGLLLAVLMVVTLVGPEGLAWPFGLEALVEHQGLVWLYGFGALVLTWLAIAELKHPVKQPYVHGSAALTERVEEEIEEIVLDETPVDQPA